MYFLPRFGDTLFLSEAHINQPVHDRLPAFRASVECLDLLRRRHGSLLLAQAEKIGIEGNSVKGLVSESHSFFEDVLTRFCSPR